MKYTNVYILLGLLLLTSLVMGLHKKTLQTNNTITSILHKKKNIYSQEKQMRCSIETPTTQRMIDIPRESPYGGIGQPVTGQPPSHFYNFDPNNRVPEETKIFEAGSTKCFDCDNSKENRFMNTTSKNFSFSNPTKCFDCEKQVKQCNRY
jgi:hypothetical protein